jgi:hypothetical protein
MVRSALFHICPHYYQAVGIDSGFEIYRFNIGSSGQQIHITCGPTDPTSTRHPCFKLPGREELEAMKKSIYDHHIRGGPAAPMAADKPGEEDSGKFSHLRVFADRIM